MSRKKGQPATKWKTCTAMKADGNNLSNERRSGLVEKIWELEGDMLKELACG